MSFTPGLTQQFPRLEDVVVAVVYGSRKGLNGVAADMDLSPTDLTRRLNAHRSEGHERPLRVDDLVHIIESTGDQRPIDWLVERFRESEDTKRQRAVETMAALAQQFLSLAEVAGVPMKRGR